MIQDDDLRSGGLRPIDLPQPYQEPVPVSEEKTDAIRAFSNQFPNLGHRAVMSEVRLQFPDLTTDEVRTVMEARG
jgi:hypothetical protein